MATAGSINNPNLNQNPQTITDAINNIPTPTVPNQPVDVVGADSDAGPGDTDAFFYIRQILDRYGLASLADWAWQKIVDGASAAEIELAMRDRPEFRTRFRAIFEREQKGLPPISPAEVVAYENAASGMMRMSGLPSGFYDSPDDYADLIGSNVSVAELAQRLNQGFDEVTNAPPEVRAAFASFYGANGDAALAAFFLDPDRSTPLLRQMATAANLAGRAIPFGMTLTEVRARQLAEAGLTSDAAQGFGDLARQAELYRETVTERQDITLEQEGLDELFGLGTGDTAERRRQQRGANFGGGGGAAATNAGVVGVGRERSSY